MKVRYLQPVGMSYEEHLLDVELSPDPLVPSAFRVETLRDLGSSVDNEATPWAHCGLFDSHLHVAWLGSFAHSVIADRFEHYENYLEALREKLRERPDGELIFSYGFAEDRWKLRKEDLWSKIGAHLDADRKWICYRVCGHFACASPGLLSSVQMDPRETLLDDQGLQILHERLPAVGSEELARDFLQGQTQLLEAGIDTVGDMSLDQPLIKTVAKLRADGRLLLDYQGVMITHARKSDALETPIVQGENFSIRHWKRYLDGSFGSRTAWLRLPYSDETATRGLQLNDTTELIDAARSALERGFALSFHAIGDAALAQLILLSQTLEPEMRSLNQMAGRPVHRIEHAQLMGDDQLQALQKLGLWIVCVQPYHREADRTFVSERLGLQRVETEAYRLSSLVNAGLPVSLGSDAPVTSFQPNQILAASDTLSPSDALWLYSEGGRQIHGFPVRELTIGARVWLL